MIHAHKRILFSDKKERSYQATNTKIYTWRNLKCLLLTERCQYEEATYHTIPNLRHFGKGKTTETAELPYDTATPLLGIYPEKTIIQKESCTKMFIAALFTIARTWKQPKCPSSDEWIKKMWHTYTMEYYSAIKRNEMEVFVMRCMDLESVIQSEVSQKEKNKYSMLTHIYGI